MKKNLLFYMSKVFYLITILFLIYIISTKLYPGKVKINSTADVKDIIEISEIQSAKFTWNGIAEIEENKNKKTYIKYKSIVEVSYDITDFFDNIKYDKKTKTIYMIIPKIKIESIIVAENGSLSYIPENSKLEMKEVLIACEKDAEKEAKENTKLLEVAEDNFKNIIKGLLYPITETDKYEIVWENGE